MPHIRKEDYTFTQSPITGEVYKCNFKISGLHYSLYNALRRTILSGIPVAAFDDTYHDDPSKNKMKIKKNVSALHNEFIAHRLSLVPICMYKSNNRIKIMVSYSTKNVIEYSFTTPDSVPSFCLKIKNDLSKILQKMLNVDNSIDVMSNHIQIYMDGDMESVESAHEYIIPDYITNGYAIIHKLKPVSINEEIQEAEELIVDKMELTIGTGRINARYCPVGTVSYEFEKDKPAVIDAHFKQYIDNLQSQRETDKLEPFSPDDVDAFKSSYHLLNAERICKRNEFDEPDSVLFSVESVGNLLADQIVFDALTMLELHTRVVLYQFSWNATKETYKYTDRIMISQNKQSGLIEIMIKNEDHTLGNLMGSYLKHLYVPTELSFATYKKPHPLEDHIIVYMGVISKDNMVNTAIKHLIGACQAFLKDIAKLKKEWSAVSHDNITEPSFDIADHRAFTEHT